MAKSIGSLVRSSGRLIKNQGQSMRTKGLLEMVQGMGVTLENTKFLKFHEFTIIISPGYITLLQHVNPFGEHNTRVLGSEIVGLVPLVAMLEAGKWFLDMKPVAKMNMGSRHKWIGLSYLEDFDPNVRIIEWAIRND